MKRITFLIITLLAFHFIGFAQSNKESNKKQSSKLSSEEIIGKHLVSIGSASALTSVKSRVMVGSVKYTPLIGEGRNLSGTAQFASEGDKILFAMIFDSTNDYLYEKAGFDGESLATGLPLGSRTRLGNFIKAYPVIFKDGLIGGTLSSAWSLLNLNNKKAKIEYAGKEKIDNQELYKLRYFPAKEGLLKITLYFDSKDFHHIMTKYEYVLTSNITTETTAARQRDTRFTLVEQFGNYKQTGQLVLPHSYSIDLTIQRNEIERWKWTMDFLQVFYNQPLDASVFNVS